MQRDTIFTEYPNSICIVSEYRYFNALQRLVYMISLRVSATNLANTNRIENPRGFRK